MSQQERWQVSGNASEAYERYLVPTMFTPWAHDLIARAALRSGEHVIDVACGTGIVARLAAAVVGSAGHVVGVDLNAGMIGWHGLSHHHLAHVWNGAKAM
jgi:ubiquinone/menaquinone biosynthesis C-methylase UbiE